MKLYGSKKKFWFFLITACLVMAVGISGVMVWTAPDIENMVKNSTAETDIILSQNQGEDVHTADPARLQKVGEEGLAQLLFDPVTFAPVVYIPSERQYWYSMQPGGAADQAVFTMEVSKGPDRYLLNSQDNSVAMGNAAAAIDQNGKKVTVTYVVAGNKVDAEAEKARLAARLTGKQEQARAAKARMAFTLKITYELKDGSLVVRVNCESLQNTADCRVLSLSLLPDFGGSAARVTDGFLLVPDGSGATIDLSRETNSFDTVTLPAYGTDLTPASAKSSAKRQPAALVPAFGIRQGSCAFLALVEDGDVWSSIRADRATGGENRRNQAYACFTLTPNSRTLVKGKGNAPDYYMDFAAEQPHKEALSVCYRFLTRSNAGVSGMAVSCREQLMRNGTLAPSGVPKEDYLPFFLSVIGEAEVEAKTAGITHQETQTLTTYEQAYDLVQQMRQKGVNAINLRYTGMLGQGGSAAAGLNSSLGGRKSLEALGTYMAQEKLNLYLDANLLTVPKSLTAKGKSAQGLDGRPVAVTKASPLSGSLGQAEETFYVRRTAEVQNTTEALLVNVKKWPVSGICLGDAGRLLPVDFSKGAGTLSKVKNAIAKQNEPLAVSHRLMVDTGNVYQLRGADAAVNVPLTSSRASAESGYEAVPFLQMILHGLLDYAGPPLNLTEDLKTAMLRAVEYGACPSFTFTYADSKLLSKENKTYYGDWLVTATDYYVKANAALYDIRGARMTGHDKVAESVYRTVYDNRVSIYVNYGAAEVKVDGIVIPANDFLKVG